MIFENKEEFEVFHFWNSKLFDTEAFSCQESEEEDEIEKERFIKATIFKQVFFIGDKNIFSEKNFDNFLEKLGEINLKCAGLYIHLLDLKDIEEANLSWLLVMDQCFTTKKNYSIEKTSKHRKLLYFPSLIIEKDQTSCRGIFIATERIENSELDNFSIKEAIFIGDENNFKKIKKQIKRISESFSSQDAHQNTLQVWESVCK